LSAEERQGRRAKQCDFREVAPRTRQIAAAIAAEVSWDLPNLIQASCSLVVPNWCMWRTAHMP
jgi:hypothetical protein